MQTADSNFEASVIAECARELLMKLLRENDPDANRPGYFTSPDGLYEADLGYEDALHLLQLMSFDKNKPGVRI